MTQTGQEKGPVSISCMRNWDFDSRSSGCFLSEARVPSIVLKHPTYCSTGLESRLKPWANLPTISFGLTCLPAKSAAAAILDILFLRLKSI